MSKRPNDEEILNFITPDIPATPKPKGPVVNKPETSKLSEEK